jgi:hypothetical protein
MTNGAKIAREELCVESIHINETLPDNFRVIGIAGIGDQGKQLMPLRMFIDSREMIVAEQD